MPTTHNGYGAGGERIASATATQRGFIDYEGVVTTPTRELLVEGMPRFQWWFEQAGGSPQVQIQLQYMIRQSNGVDEWLNLIPAFASTPGVIMRGDLPISAVKVRATITPFGAGAGTINYALLCGASS